MLNVQVNQTIQIAEAIIAAYLKQEFSSAFRFTKLAGDASGKQFFRVHYQNEAYILICLPTHGAASDEFFIENQNSSYTQAEIFIEVGYMLAQHMPNIPKIYAMNAAHGLVVQSDHGQQVLDAYLLTATMPNQQIIAMYKKLFDWIIDLQQLDKLMPPRAIATTRHFEQQSILQELEDFIGFAIARGKTLTAYDSEKILVLRAGFQQLAHYVAATPVALIHRDMQSKNIMIEPSQLTVIDFQDLCWGPCWYDVASLIYDPYVNFPPLLQAELTEIFWARYQQQLPSSVVTKAQFLETLHITAVQRLLKCAGRYARLLYRDGKTSHIKYLEPAVNSGLRLLAQYPQWKYLQQLMEELLNASLGLQEL